MSPTLLFFGELLLRLGAPGRERLLQSPRLDVHVGGAEANVAIALARFGHSTAMVSIVPDQALGEHVLGELRRHRIDTQQVLRQPGRMGLYFLETGALQRPSDVLYDRADSAFARNVERLDDWPTRLRGIRLLHLSGVTPALGAAAARAAINAAEQARALGISVIFDGNYRSKLWQAWNSDAPGILRQILSCTDLLFADHRDIAVVLGRDYAALPAETRDRAAANDAFSAFPQISRIASTVRMQSSVDSHQLSAQLFTRDATLLTQTRALESIVDRIGAGDAFAAGVLHGMLTARSDEDSLNLGLAAACLKHSIPGDYLHATLAEVEALIGGQRLDVRR